MWKGNPAAAGLLTLLDCPFDANTWKAFGGSCHRLICMLCGVQIKYFYFWQHDPTQPKLSVYPWRFFLEKRKLSNFSFVWRDWRNYLRSTIGHERLSSFALISIECDLSHPDRADIEDFNENCKLYCNRYRKIFL